MWVYNNDLNKWGKSTGSMLKADFDYLKQELSATRFYSKFLSGSTYIPINDVDNIYDILGKWSPRSWYIGTLDSKYSYSNSPAKFARSINNSTSDEYYTKFISEYGLTLKNLFTSTRIIKDSVDNYIPVYAASDSSIDLTLTYNSLKIDDVVLKAGNMVLIKDQVTNVTLTNTTDPDVYFKGNYKIINNLGTLIEYQFYNSENGVYLYNGESLVKQNILDDYKKCVRMSVSVESGTLNSGKQFHLNRLLNGYFPTSLNSDPMEFVERHNWLLRNRVDYNNLFEINYFDVIKEGTHSYYSNGVTYSIPERTIAVGEFGVILNTQFGTSNIIPNKYKVNLRSVSKTTTDYWICGDDTTLLKVRKHDFEVTLIKIDSLVKLNSISFFDDLRGVVVGDLNTILLTTNAGQTWNKLKIDDFAAFTYNKVLFSDFNRIYIVGRNGIFLEIVENVNGWTAYRRRISKQIDEDDEYLLVENINDMYKTSINNWGLTYSYNNKTTAINKELLFIVTDNNNIIAHDINSSTDYDFLYLDFGKDYGDILNIAKKESSNILYFTSNDGLYSFNITDFKSIGIGNSYSNAISGTYAKLESSLYANEIFDYKGEDLLLAGNTSLLRSATYSLPMNFNVLDSNFESRLKPKLLFLDYDMGSKLNFFTDQGSYRLPSSSTFSLTDTSGSTIFASASGTINLPISDNTLLNSIINVDPNSIKVSDLRVKLNIEHSSLYSISVSLRKLSDPGAGKIITLMPNNVAGPNANFVDFTFTTNQYYPKFSNLLYSSYTEFGPPSYNNKTAYILTKDNNNNFYPAYRDVNNNNNIVYANTSDFKDMVKLPNSYNIGGQWELLIYDWNTSGLTNRKLINWEISFIKDSSSLEISPIVHSSTAPSYLVKPEVNWWNYWTDSEKTFEYWTTATMSDTSNVLINSTFSGYDLYTTKFPSELTIDRVDIDDTTLLKLAPSFNYSGTKNDSRFNSNLGPQIITTNLPSYVSTSTGRLYLKDYLMVLETDLNWSVDKGDVIRIESDIIDTNLIVNKILTIATQSVPNIADARKFIYMYSEFNDNIISELSKSIGSIKIKNLNKYTSIDKLVDNFNYHPLSNAYSATQSNGIFSIDPKFNAITSYYNLGAKFKFNGLTSTMSYSDSFIKFGYSPRYNLLDYMESMNTNLSNPSFYATKEYLAMPVYKGIPLGSLTPDSVFIDKSGLNAVFGGTASVKNDYGNRLVFGPNLKLEWESIFINTFVDVSIYHNGSTIGTYSSEKLLVLNKYKAINYKDSGIDPYIIEFDKSIKFELYSSFLTGSTVDIISRRTLKQISDDLQELNNIQRSKSKISKLDKNNSTYTNYGSGLNFKLSTDSYAKILLSDSETVKELSAIMYTDYKNEIAMNVTRLDRAYNIPISNTIDYNGQLYINCSEKHGLVLGDGLVLEFNGGTFSSQYLNQQYFGYHFVEQVINEYDFIVEIPYGNPVYIGNDTGFVKYLRKDPFFNYQPVDLIEVGLNKKGNVAIKLDVDNVKLDGATFSLTNVNYNRYRYRLLDGLTLDTINLRFPWLLEAEVTDAVVGIDDKQELVWYKGIWESGRWFGGNWVSGTWKYGDWYGGTWNSQNVTDKGLSVDVDLNSSGSTQSIWFTGRWYDGTWNDGTWVNGRWYDGTWERGTWNNGIWNDGTWNYGRFIGGIWVEGTWNDGIFNTDNEQSFWLNGQWNGGDFENGIWYNGFFGEDNSLSRFGTNAYNSRTAIWYGGKWKSGSFYSQLSDTGVSDVHKYSVWYSGQWMSGDFRGGIAYNMTFNSGTWYGGILEEIQLIGINSANNSFILNGRFKFNIGDEIYIIDNNVTTEYSKYGSNSQPGKYTILYVVENTTTKLTEVYVDENIDTTNLASYKKNSGLLNLSIPNYNSSPIISTQTIPYDVTTTNEIRVKLNLTNNYIGDLIINLKSPNGDVINLKEYGLGSTQSVITGTGVYGSSSYSVMSDTIFTTDTSNVFDTSYSSTYTGTYEMSKTINQGNQEYQSSTNDYKVLLSNGSVKGDWVLYVKDNRSDLRGANNSTGLKHSGRYTITTTCSAIGDNFKISISVNGGIALPEFRVGDNIKIELLNYPPPNSFFMGLFANGIPVSTSATYNTDIIAFSKSGSSFELTVGLTASASNLQNNFVYVNTAGAGLVPNNKYISYANIYSSSNPRPENKLIDWEIQFVNDYEVGAQINYQKEDGFDTGLRVVSNFKNANWKSGIWTNGIYDNGVFEGGVWYNGIFNATWG